MQKTSKLFPLLTALNLLLTLGLLVLLLVGSPARPPSQEQSSDALRYTLHIGLNDKDTYTQEISTEEARSIVDAICLKYADAFTVSEAQGAWTDASGALTRENTLIYVLSGTSEAQITAIMDEVLIALNQSTILVYTDAPQAVFYSDASDLS